MTWRSLNNPIYQWVTTINRILKVEDPPTLTGSILYIASDYSGTEKSSRYRVSAIVCADIEKSIRWEMQRREARRRYMADGRRMSYKALSDRQRARALLPFLDAATEITGLCLVTIVHRDILHLCANSGDYDKIRVAAGLKARWKNRELEEALRLTHLIAVVIGGLSQPSQNIYWISDQDDLFANSERNQDMTRLLSFYSSHYTKHSLGELGMGTTEIDEGDRFDEDLSAVADLVAGAVSETTNRLSELCGGRIPHNLAVEYLKPFIPKTEVIARWFFSQTGELRRAAILFEKRDTGFSVSRHQMLTD